LNAPAPSCGGHRHRLRCATGAASWLYPIPMTIDSMRLFCMPDIQKRDGP
jgi:hypothetical protein